MTSAFGQKKQLGSPGEQLSFFEPPPFEAAWPKHHTFADKALKMLLDGKVFDHSDYLDGCGSWRLASAVFELRALGWPIETVKIPAPSKESSNRYVALYRLDIEFVAHVSATTAGGAA